MSEQNYELRSIVTDAGTLELEVHESEIPKPNSDEVVVKISAAALNPSDLLTLVGPGNVTTAKADGEGRSTLQLREGIKEAVAARIGKPLMAGNEGAGVVVEAGSDPAAQALMGRVVGVVGVGTYARYRVVKAAETLPVPKGTEPVDVAAWYVNPMTALGFVDTMLSEGFIGIVHTAAASALGQILLRICQEDEIPIVNIVRSQTQVALLRSLGAQHICDSSQQSFHEQLVQSLKFTGARLCFDALGGGLLASDILSAMEQADKAKASTFSRYGSSDKKRVYNYGSLEKGPMVLDRNYGTAWSVGGWFVTSHLNSLSPERIEQYRKRIASGLKTTFKTNFQRTLSLREAILPKNIRHYGENKTGEKVLIDPSA